MRVLHLLPGDSASMSFLYVYFFPFFYFEFLENTNRTLLMFFEEYNITEDCEFSLVYITDNKIMIIGICLSLNFVFIERLRVLPNVG